MNATPQHLGKYELLQQLGRGGVGDVWKARDLQLRRDVAIKILHSDLQSDPHFLTRFTHEGQHIASLHHSNIVQVHEINVTRPSQASETTAYIAMEYIEGQTLSSYLRDTSHRGIFPTVSQIVYLFQCLGAAIDYAHQKNIVHGNVKPNNILLNMRDISQFETGEPMLSDFALPRLLGPNATISTPAYMAPEQARGLAPAGRSDIYALGVILYEICTGVQPFRDESSVAVMMQHINAQPTPPIQINPGIPLALSEVILHALTKEASARFPSGTALAHAIADACSSFTSIQGPRQPTNPLLLNKLPRHGSLLGVPEPSPMPNEPSLLPRTTQSLPGTQSSPTFPIQAVQPSLSTTRQFSQPLPKSTFVPPSSIQDQFSQPLPPLPEVTGSYEQNTSLMVQAQSSPVMPPTPPASATPAQPPSGSKRSSVPRYIYIVTIVLLVLLVGATLLAS
ncbi:MAG: serine/threonine protein kinase, partial [Ktedonobacteraceae bacterium]|nr:serine/threonine protein kinase [Ktedonobacteraceae bacterium]